MKKCIMLMGLWSWQGHGEARCSAKIDAVDVGTKIYADPLAPSDARTIGCRVPVFSVVHVSSPVAGSSGVPQNAFWPIVLKHISPISTR
jgi:hypothetical protein